LSRPYVVFSYKHYSNNPNVSHQGLGVTAVNCAKYLIERGIEAFVLPAQFEADIEKFLKLNPHVTHLVVAALWIRTETFQRWSTVFPRVKFATICHSNQGFLQHEPAAITLLRQGVALEELSTNFHVAANSERFCEYFENTYGSACTYLPNLYFLNHLHHASHHKPWSGGTLRIGIFGAMRALKNFNTAAGASMNIARQLKTHTEIWVNVARRDSSDADVVLNSVRNASRGVPLVKLVEYPWAPWPEFRKTIGSMHLLMQPSYSETFNNVTADGVSEGVPSVVSNAITWAPSHWKANVDDVLDVARVGVSLIHDHNAAKDGIKALKAHNEESFRAWRKFLGLH
jgi:hypothetical protein